MDSLYSHLRALKRPRYRFPHVPLASELYVNCTSSPSRSQESSLVAVCIGGGDGVGVAAEDSAGGSGAGAGAAGAPCALLVRACDVA